MPLRFGLVLLQAAALTSPASGDTTGYWQQRADYAIAARLDESTSLLRATATLTYVNHSPDTLHEFYVHQYLNAFRPASRWSEVDAREGRVRFQNLADPDYAFERFTETPTFDGVPVAPEYPGAPDSTVVRFALPRPLQPGDTVRVHFAWQARPSTLPRRQGRRGRSFDFAQWYPKVAVYDRGGWQAQPLVPAGEFYGEFGDFDVTLDVATDQVLGATGVVVEGDPGWERARRWGTVAGTPCAYGLPDTAAAAADRPPPAAGSKRVRFVAQGVHHFGWSTSPDYRYEGTYYVRNEPPREMRFPVYDSVGVHVLYRPGDEDTWGRGQVVARTITALRWLESVYGPYGYPQMTVLHRIESGGTEFPMLQMNGSPSQGLILHEGGHIYSYGLLANNEWRSGWMDEGLTSYQTSWALNQTPQERARQLTPPAPSTRTGYRAKAARPATSLGAIMLDLTDRAEPLGTSGPEFSEFSIYSASVYTRGERMYSALRDVMGDSAFRAFLRGYYDRWAFRHVDELAMRTEAERAYGASLGWFFDQWLRKTGLVDYALDAVRTRQEGETWVTTGRVTKRGEYLHPVALGVRTDTGWVTGRGDPLTRSQLVTVRTAQQPLEVRLDPIQAAGDWFGPNDAGVALPRLDPRTAQLAFDWPLLDQSLSDRYLTAFSPLAWYSRPGGLVLALRMRSNYRGLVNQLDFGLASSVKVPERQVQAGPEFEPASPSRHASRLQGWLTVENPRLPGMASPVIGLTAGTYVLDGVALVGASRTWDQSRFVVGGTRVSTSLTFTGTYPYDRNWPDTLRWGLRQASDLTVAHERRWPESRGTTLRVALTGGLQTGSWGADSGGDPYARGEGVFSWLGRRRGSPWAHFVRGYAAFASKAPPERGLYVSGQSPTESFGNHLWRPDEGLLALPEVNYTPLGGAGLRGFEPLVRVNGIVAVNLEEARALHRFGEDPRAATLYATVFADGGYYTGPEQRMLPDRALADAGVGLAVRGLLFDRDVRFRVDVPLWVSTPEAAVGLRDREPGDVPSAVALRWTFSFSDIW